MSFSSNKKLSSAFSCLWVVPTGRCGECLILDISVIRRVCGGAVCKGVVRILGVAPGLFYAFCAFYAWWIFVVTQRYQRPPQGCWAKAAWDFIKHFPSLDVARINMS